LTAGDFVIDGEIIIPIQRVRKLAAEHPSPASADAAARLHYPKAGVPRNGSAVL
jgi:hypothetical protein